MEETRRKIIITSGKDKTVYETNSAEETMSLANDLAQGLTGGEVITLQGDLGAGKTVFAKGLAEALGVTEVVNSPTFVIMKIYKLEAQNESLKELCHIDAYRLGSSEELEAIGSEDYLCRPGVITLIEWPELVSGLKGLEKAVNVSISIPK